MDKLRHQEQLPVEADVDDRIEVWEPDSNDRIRPASRPAFRNRFTTSAPGAVAGAFLVCALALGASLGAARPNTSPAGDTAALNAAVGGTTGDAILANGAGHEDGWGDGDHYGGDAKPGAEEPKPDTDEPKPDTEEPKEPPKDEPDTSPAVHTIGLDVALGDGGAVKLDWGACEIDGFIAWKVIRATDGTPTYPRGDGDVLVRVIENQGQTAFTDTDAPAGKKLFYAIFGLGGEGYTRDIACATGVKWVKTPVAEPKPEPKPEPKDPPADKPAMSLALSIKEGAIYVDWSGCEADGAEVYKVVRSSNSTVSWPAGDGDTLVAAIGIGDKTAAWDEHAPAGKKAWYRVFCVRHTDDGYKVLVASAVRYIVAPAGDPAPKPSAMWIEVKVEGGNVVVHWEACGGESFSHYRIVRKVDGVSSVVTEIENAGVTTWVDNSVEAGKSYKYLVQSKGVIDGSYVLLGTTDYAAVTVE